MFELIRKETALVQRATTARITFNSLESTEDITKPGDIGSNELICAACSDPGIEVNDFVEGSVSVEVEIVDVSGESCSERESEFRLEEAKH